MQYIVLLQYLQFYVHTLVIIAGVKHYASSRGPNRT